MYKMPIISLSGQVGLAYDATLPRQPAHKKPGKDWEFLAVASQGRGPDLLPPNTV